MLAANDVSGEQPMGDRPTDAAAPPPGELSRVLVAIVTLISVTPSSFLLSLFHTSARSFDSV